MTAADVDEDLRDVHALWCAVWQTAAEPCNCGAEET